MPTHGDDEITIDAPTGGGGGGKPGSGDDPDFTGGNEDCPDGQARLSVDGPCKAISGTLGGGGKTPAPAPGPDVEYELGLIGCTNPQALNFDQYATHPCGSWGYFATEAGRNYDGNDLVVEIEGDDCCIYPGYEDGDIPGVPTPGEIGCVDSAFCDPKASKCDPPVGELVSEAPTLTCFENADAFVPNWMKMTEEEPFFNQRTCEYSIVMLADPPDCSPEYLDSYIPAAVGKLLSYYNKEEMTPFITSIGDEELYSSKGALIDGVSGKTREAWTFKGTAEVKTFYISPRPLEKTKVLITVSAEEFNRIPEKEENFSQVAETAFGVKPSYVVFYTKEILRIFDIVARNMKFYENAYADWHLQTGKIIKGLNLTADSGRLENFYKELMLLLAESDLTYNKLETLEIGFDSKYKIEYIKVKQPFRPPVLLKKGFKAFIERPENNNITTMAYMSRLPDIKEDMVSRIPVSWYDMLAKYRYPHIEEAYINDLTSPLVDGNEGVKKLAESSCPEASSAFEPKKTPGEWALTQVNSIKDALLNQLREEPCLLVDGKILEERNKESLAMQMVDLTLKEYLSSDRIISDLPALLANGKWDSIEELYGGMLNNLGYCGIIDLVKSAIDCLLNALGYDDSIKIIVRAAIRGMDNENFAKFINDIPVPLQEIIVAHVAELAPQVLPFLQSLVTVRIVDDGGIEIEAVHDRTLAYSYTSAGKWTHLESSSSSSSSPVFFNQAADINYPPASAEDYATLNEVVADLVMDDLLGVDDILAVLETLPGAPIAISILEKMDKFCAAPPRFYPPLSDIISLPGINMDICQLQDGITFGQSTFKMPQTTQAGMGGVIMDNVLMAIKEIARRLLILILQKILEIIFEETCKQRVNTDPTGLRDLMMAGCSGDMDPAVVNEALADIAGTLNCLSDAEALGRFIDNISSVLTECELVDLIRGTAADSIYDLIYQIIQVDPLTAPLAECLNDKDSITDFFKSISVFIDLDKLCTLAPLDLPFSQEVCDDLGLLALFRDTRAQALRDKGVDEECINDQLCLLRDKTIEDLKDLTDMLHSGLLDDLLPNIMKDPKEPEKPSLLPAIDPATAISVDSAFNAMYEALIIQYTDDLVGSRGFLNMCLADSRGRGYQQHLNFQRSILGPSVFNIYGSRGTRTQPAWDEWGAGANSKAAHNKWVQEELEYTDGTRFWMLPFLFNPLAAVVPDGQGNNRSPDVQGDPGSDENTLGYITQGMPPAVGGLPDKVAGYLQEQLLALSPSFYKDNSYSTIIHWEEYGDDLSEFDVNISYDYHVDGYPYDRDGYRLKVEVDMELGRSLEAALGLSPRKTESTAYLIAEDPVSPDVLDLIRNRVAAESGRSEETPADIWGSFVEGIIKNASENPDAVPEDLYTTFSNSVFDRINTGFLKRLSDDISKVDIFDYGFDFESVPKIIYFDQEGEEYEGNLPGAVERYGGTEANPPFYVEPPTDTGFMRLANSIVPEFSACSDQQSSAKFPNFSELKKVAANMAEKVKDDRRLSSCGESMVNVIEAPFERALPAGAVALNESLIYSTIRIYLSEFMLKSLPAFYFLKPKYPDNYTNMISEYLIEKMEKGMKVTGRGRFYGEDYADYYYVFLEQVVQSFTTKIEYKLLTDPSEAEAEALEIIYDFVENNWAGYVSPRRIGIIEANRRKQENWRGIMKQSLIQDNCKVILRRYIGEEVTRMATMLGDALPVEPPYPIESVNDLLINSPSREPTEVQIPTAKAGITYWTDIPYMAGAVNKSSDNGPVDVPTLLYYTDAKSGQSTQPHPLDTLSPPIGERNWPFVLERYVTYRGTGFDSINQPYGKIANIFDWENVVGRDNSTDYQVGFNGQLYFGLRLSYVPNSSDVSSSKFDMIESNIDEGVSYSDKAYEEVYKNLIPLVAVEEHIAIPGDYKAEDYSKYLQPLICKLIETPEYKMTFKYVFPVARYMSLLAIYISNAFVPSLAQVKDGWAATVLGNHGGGQWIGFWRHGGMKTWRGDEGMGNSFHKSKTVARQLLEGSCSTNYLYRDRDLLNPSDEIILSRVKNDKGLGIKWWQWSSLRPAPCKKEE